jgi:hypothetical protein
MAELVTYSRENILNQLEARLGLNNQNRDSFARILSEVIGSELEAVEREIIDSFRDQQLENLTGEELEDYVFNNYNISRYASRRATANNFQVTVSAGESFGELNNNNDIIIPAGTRISTDDSYSAVVFKTTAPITLPSDISFISTSIEAENPGSSYNTVASSLRYIDFTDYSQGSDSLLVVSNPYDISNGSDQESDFSLRLRAMRFLERKSTLNKSALFSGLLNEPSIFDFDLIESYYGIGSIGVLVRGHGYGRVSDADIEKVKQIISEFKFLGQMIEVVTPREVTLNLNLTVISRTVLNDAERVILTNEINNFIYSELKNMEFERNISLNSLSTKVLERFNIEASENSNVFTGAQISKIERFAFDISYREVNLIGLGLISLEIDETLTTPVIDITVVNNQ